MIFRLTWQLRPSHDPLVYEVDDSRILSEFLQEKSFEEHVNFVGCHTFFITSTTSPPEKRFRKVSNLNVPIRELQLQDGDIFHVNVIARCIGYA